MDALRPGVQLLPAFVQLPAKGRGKIGLRAALVLSQAFYMSKRSGGGSWEYTPADWTGSTGLSEDQTSRALRVLVDAGYLSRRQVSRVRVMSYTVELSALESALLSCAPITAELRLCKTAVLRPCKTADSRLSLDREAAFLKKSAVAKRPPHSQQVAAPVRGNRARASLEELGTSREAWDAYAASLSPAWVESGDAGSCWDALAAVGWRDAGRRLVRDWQAQARRLLDLWRKERGGKAIEAKAGKLAAARAQVAQEVEDARNRLERVQERAQAEDWTAVVELERLWRIEAPGTFAAYMERHRPRDWTRKIASAPPASRWKPGTPARR